MLPVDEILQHLHVNDLVPRQTHAIFVGGSFARGWNHANSDLDLFVFTDQPWRSATSVDSPVSLRPESISTETLYVDDVRWEIRYWLDQQVDQVFAKVSDEEFRTGNAWRTLTTTESILLERIGSGLIVTGADWMERRRQQLDASAFRAIVIADALLRADDDIEDAVGLLEAGDVDTAVVCARLALGNVADAVVASHGELGQEEKWRARRVALVGSPLLPFERYWELETMRSYDPANARGWVENIARICQSISQKLTL
jgi:hypothetical protein